MQGSPGVRTVVPSLQPRRLPSQPPHIVLRRCNTNAAELEKQNILSDPTAWVPVQRALEKARALTFFLRLRRTGVHDGQGGRCTRSRRGYETFCLLVLTTPSHAPVFRSRFGHAPAAVPPQLTEMCVLLTGGASRPAAQTLEVRH